jgi:hypothetical protein
VVGEITLEKDIDEILGLAETAGDETSRDAIQAAATLEPEDEDDASEGEGDDEEDED